MSKVQMRKCLFMGNSIAQRFFDTIFCVSEISLRGLFDSSKAKKKKKPPNRQRNHLTSHVLICPPRSPPPHTTRTPNEFARDSPPHKAFHFRFFHFVYFLLHLATSHCSACAFLCLCFVLCALLCSPKTCPPTCRRYCRLSRRIPLLAQRLSTNRTSRPTSPSIECTTPESSQPLQIRLVYPTCPGDSARPTTPGSQNLPITRKRSSLNPI